MIDEDRKQIGLTKEGQAAVKRLQEDLNWFNEARDVGRFALAYAVRQGVQPGFASNVETRWSPDGFDPDSELRDLIRALFPSTKTPVRVMESLIDQGLRMISRRLDEGDDEPLDYIDV